MSSGISLTLDLGTLIIGDHFFCNKNCTISCNDRVVIGDGALLGWDIEILDSDNHTLIHKNREENRSMGEIIIGDHVWITSFSHILKNSVVPDGSVVAYNSLVTKAFQGEKLLIGGSPAKVLEEQIEWKQ